MNFFRAQELARKRSRRLVIMFTLAMLGVITTFYAVFQIIVNWYAATDLEPSKAGSGGFLDWFDLSTFVGTAVIVGGVILAGSLYKFVELGKGGAVVARDLGGREVDPETADFHERRLLNVVEEMSIASGTPIPGVWILDYEDGINAFAAGTEPENAVVGVTRGAVERLTRAELQGVIAHEFSHIINGDMKLNMRLIGWIFGLVMLAMLGQTIFSSVRFMRFSGRGSRDSGWIIVAIVVIGAVVWLLGSVGVFFTRIIQASISREREYLADAAAVQFTRDPDGIAGALMKVGGFSMGGRVQCASAAEARHMFFSSSFKSEMFATHPPLERRIRKILPRWQGEMLSSNRNTASLEAGPDGSLGFSGGQLNPSDIGDAANLSGMKSHPKVSQIEGQEGLSPIEVGRRIRQTLNNGENLAHTRADARCITLGALVNPDFSQKIEQALSELGWQQTEIDAVINWGVKLASVDETERLLLIDTSLPWLKKMPFDEAARFVAASQRLIELDGRVTLFEFTLQKVIERQIVLGVGLARSAPIRFNKLEQLDQPLRTMLGAFAAVSDDPSALRPALEEYRMHTGVDLHGIKTNGIDLKEVAMALEKIDQANPLIKNQCLRLCRLVVQADGVVKQAEAQLIRATSEALGLPMGILDLNHD